VDVPKVSDDYKARRRQKVMDSALLCFAEKGFVSSTMDDIVERSGTSKGMVYNYFKSKEELYAALMEERSSKMFLNLREKFQQVTTATDKLKELFANYLEGIKNEGYQDYLKVHFEWLIFASRNENYKKQMVDRYEKEVCAFVEEIIDEGIAKGEFHPDLDSASMASIFWAQVDGLSLAYALSGNQHRYRNSLADAEKMLMKYLLVKE
jgi:AcrR family transcriptional regulator